MKKMMIMTAVLCSLHVPAYAETNALIEVKLFKDWVIKEEVNFGNFNLAIKNTGTAPILLAKDPGYFQIGQLATRLLPRDPQKDSRQEEEYKIMGGEGECFRLLPEETHVYERRKFFLPKFPIPFSEEMRFTVSVYLGKGFWLDSEPLVYRVVTPDSEGELATINDNKTRNTHEPSRKLSLVTYRNERWLYVKSISGDLYYSVCPLSSMNTIRVEPHDGGGLFKIWDGSKPMIFDMYKMMLLEGSDENNVYGRWTRERKQKAEADNAEVRRKKAEAQAP
ncbi:MAG: hypothetical protein FWG50_11955 [Kiritimatiellaeota bacterium]|nr:hypothetical protein [Kiritimatiellota bacterium]